MECSKCRCPSPDHRGCRDLYEERPWLPESQMAPVRSKRPAAGHSWAGGTSGKSYIRKGNMLHSSCGRKEWVKIWEKEPCRKQNKRRRRERRCSRHPSKCCPAAPGETTQIHPEGPQPSGRTSAGAVQEGLCSLEGTPSWSRETVRNSRKEMLWTHQNFHSSSACTSQGGWQWRKETEPGKKKKKGQGARGVVLIHISYNSVLIDNKLTSPVEPVLLVTATAKWSSGLYLNPWAFWSYFLPLSCWGGGVRERLGMHLTPSQGQTFAVSLAYGFLNPKFALWSQSVHPVCILCP